MSTVSDKELIKTQQSDIASLEKKLKSSQDKSRKNTNAFKDQLKEQAKAVDADRQKAFKRAKKASKKLKRKAKKIAAEIRSTDRSLLGVSGQGALDAKLEVLEQLFGGV